MQSECTAGAAQLCPCSSTKSAHDQCSFVLITTKRRFWVGKLVSVDTVEGCRSTRIGSRSLKIHRLIETVRILVNSHVHDEAIVSHSDNDVARSLRTASTPAASTTQHTSLANWAPASPFTVNLLSYSTKHSIPPAAQPKHYEPSTQPPTPPNESDTASTPPAQA